jgi:hypothetical protein
MISTYFRKTCCLSLHGNTINYTGKNIQQAKGNSTKQMTYCQHDNGHNFSLVEAAASHWDLQDLKQVSRNHKHLSTLLQIIMTQKTISSTNKDQHSDHSHK